MYCEYKHGEYWVWSSRKASLDFLPQFKFKTKHEAKYKMLHNK